MNKKVLLLCISLLLCAKALHSQCNQKLVELAAEKAGTDAIFIRDFKVRLSKGTMDTPSPTGKFPIYLNEGTTYRFTIENASEFPGEAYIELERRGQTYISNYSFDNVQYVTSFDFECNRSATYQLLINFGENKEGCSAVVMSFVMKDTLMYIEPGVPLASDSAETLYMWVENELQIASSESRYAELNVNISQGSINKQGRFYFIEPAHTGELMVMVDVLKDDKIIESDSILYEVILPPLPTLQFKGIYASQIHQRDLYRIEKVEIMYPIDIKSPPYSFDKFAITESMGSIERYYGYSENLTSEQKNFLTKLAPGQNFYITDIVVSDPDGKKHYPSPVQFHVVE